MQTTTSTWTAAEIRQGGNQIKPVTVTGSYEGRTDTFEGFAVFNGKGEIVYGPVVSRKACEEWIAR